MKKGKAEGQPSRGKRPARLRPDGPVGRRAPRGQGSAAWGPSFARLPRGETRPGSLISTLSLPEEAQKALAAFEGVLDEVLPLNDRQRFGLKNDVRDLWSSLTSEKDERAAEYLGKPAVLSAYTRYFLPWNLYRLIHILPGLDLGLKEGSVLADIGSGPLTFPIALWMARPELRGTPMTVYCVDRVARCLEKGQALLETLAIRVGGKAPPWKIASLRESFGARLPEKVDLYASANLFNEFFWKDKSPLSHRAMATSKNILAYLKPGGRAFLMEPGDPRSGSFLSALRAAFIANGLSPLSPCPHAKACPFSGLFSPPRPGMDDGALIERMALPGVAMPKRRPKMPWCHFPFELEKVPSWLSRLSSRVGLSKDRIVASWLLVGPGREAGADDSACIARVVSDAFRARSGLASYACSEAGYSIVRHGPEPFPPGSLVSFDQPSGIREEKSGAVELGY